LADVVRQMRCKLLSFFTIITLKFVLALYTNEADLGRHTRVLIFYSEPVFYLTHLTGSGFSQFTAPETYNAPACQHDWLITLHVLYIQ